MNSILIVQFYFQGIKYYTSSYSLILFLALTNLELPLFIAFWRFVEANFVANCALHFLYSMN